MAFVVLPEFEVAPGNLTAFLKAARADAARSVADEPGCLQFDVTVEGEDPARVVFYEVYRSREAFDAHLETPHLAEFQKALSLVERELPVRFLDRRHP